MTQPTTITAAQYATAARAFVAEVSARHGLTMDSAEMERCITLNPSNLPGHPDAPAMCPAHAAQARCEDEGRRAYPHGRNPYMARTAAAVWWANGWHQADAKACPEVHA